MQSKLVIVESPAKAKTIAKYLGKDYIVESTIGHIADLSTGGVNRLGVDIKNGFTPKYQILKDKKDRVAAIVDAAKRSSKVYIASDPDREGEAIAWHVLNAIKNANKSVKRVEFQEITPAAVKKGISNPRDLDKALFDAQQARRVLDRLVGFMVSPYLWDAFGPGLSAGRVQSVCLRLIVDREIEIENFKPDTYWEISATLEKNKEKFVAKYPTRIKDKKKSDNIKNDLDNSTFKVIDVKKKPKKVNPFPPFTTSKLQQLASSKFKFSAKKTLSVAQSLYEGGHVTYIRTDSIRNSPESIAAARKWLKENKFEYPKSANAYKVKGGAQDAHEAIRPTSVEQTPENFTGTADQKKIYQLIWQRFVASQMPPAEYDTVAVVVQSSKGNHKLKANGQTLKKPGWLEISPDGASKKDVKLPNLDVGDEVKLTPPKVKNEKKETKPPPRYTDATMVRELETKGIGRPSTFAAILSKIADRNYVEKENNHYIPTKTGRQIILDLTKHFSFMNYDYTKNMEDQLDKIGEGKLEYIEMMNGFFASFEDELRKAHLSQYKDGQSDCAKCGGRTILKYGKYGYYIACIDRDCNHTQSVELDGDTIKYKQFNKIVDGIECPKCGSTMAYRDGKFGPFYACTVFSCKGTRKVPFGKQCKLCGNELYLIVFKAGTPESNMKLACMGYPNCKNVEDVPDDAEINWVDPAKINPKHNKQAKKILKNGKRRNRSK